MTERRDSDPEQLQFEFGAQRLTLEPPWLAQLELRDPLTVDDILAVLGVLGSWITRHGQVSVMIDMNAVTGVPSDVRRLGVNSVLDYQALAVFGASFPVRVVVSMLVRATQVVKRDAVDFPLKFFSTKEDALVWLRGLSRG